MLNSPCATGVTLQLSFHDKRSGGNTKVYVCKEYKKYAKAYELKVRHTPFPIPRPVCVSVQWAYCPLRLVHLLPLSPAHPPRALAPSLRQVKDEKGAGADQYLEDHPYDGHNACDFVLCINKKKKGDTWRVSSQSKLTHGPTCSAVGKVKARMLTALPTFRSQVFAQKGAGKKASSKSLEAAGISGVAVPTDAVTNARKSVEGDHYKLYEEKFAALPQYLHDVCTANGGSFYHVLTDDAGQFRAAFLCIGPVVQAIRKFGRRVSGTDFGHSTSKVFEGVYAANLRQTGSGTLVPLFLACFGGDWKTEAGCTWQYCAEQVQAAGISDLFGVDHAHFHDRQKGAKYFEQAFPADNRMQDLMCAKHLLDNARDNAPKEEKNFPPGLFWAAQGSRSMAEYYSMLEKFKKPFPCTYKYLESLDPSKWVLYAQINRGVSTYGWRTSGMAEIGMSMIKEIRGMHPLDAFDAFVSKSIGSVAAEQEKQIEYAAQPAGKAFGLVPFVVNAAEELSDVAGKCTVSRLAGAQYKSMFTDHTVFDTHTARVVDIEKGMCTCLKYQEYNRPCKDALAAHQLEGRSWQDVLRHKDVPIDTCYRLDAGFCKSLVCTTIVAPGVEELRARKESEAYAKKLREAAEAEDIVIVSAPPRRKNEAHGNSTRARKRKNDGSGSKGRTQTRRYKKSATEKLKAKHKCKKCEKAGREGAETYKHRSGTCPYDVPDGDIMLVDDDADDDDTPLADMVI